MNIQNLQQKNGTLLTVNLKVVIRIMISVLQFLIGAQFLVQNATCVAAASVWLLWIGLLPAAAIVLVITIFPVTKIYASE